MKTLQAIMEPRRRFGVLIQNWHFSAEDMYQQYISYHYGIRLQCRKARISLGNNRAANSTPKSCSHPSKSSPDPIIYSSHPISSFPQSSYLTYQQSLP